MARDEIRKCSNKHELSVVICAHNPRPEHLCRVLSALQSQTFPLERWELLLVDNASDIPLASLFDLSWHPHGRHVLERALGIAEARRRGMLEAASDLIVFVDDDNVLDGEYLSLANTIKQEWPMLGTWGSGLIALEFEQQPSRHLERYFPNLAFRDSKVPRWSNIAPCIDATPVGAGLCVRRSVATAYCEMFERSKIKIKSREGHSLLGHEDFEISYVACHMGLGMGLFPALKILHLIPKQRITEDYLVKLYEGGRLSNLMLAYKWQGVAVDSPFTGRGILSILANFLVRRGIDRRMYVANLRASLKARRLLAEGPHRASDVRRDDK
jgi:glycosyltransferase involved in cell wall biosynthesis